eukprot:Amastigsp_a174826_87.p1 type:complete len:254 gc:universal Amastigsp_a174826_87:1456-695(-)
MGDPRGGEETCCRRAGGARRWARLCLAAAAECQGAQGRVDVVAVQVRLGPRYRGARVVPHPARAWRAVGVSRDGDCRWRNVAHNNRRHRRERSSCQGRSNGVLGARVQSHRHARHNARRRGRHAHDGLAPHRTHRQVRSACRRSVAHPHGRQSVCGRAVVFPLLGPCHRRHHRRRQGDRRGPRPRAPRVCFCQPGEMNKATAVSVLRRPRAALGRNAGRPLQLVSIRGRLSDLHLLCRDNIWLTNTEQLSTTT